MKAVLQRLQRISTEPGPAEPQTPAETPPLSDRRVVVAAALAIAAVVIVAGAFALLDFNRPTVSTAGHPQPPPAAASPKTAPESKPAAAPGSTPIPRSDTSLAPPAAKPQSPSTAKPALDVALGLLTTGRVQAARKQLLGLVSEDAADVAWALARSYDPNFLSTIPAADAGPDVAEATRWYRTWYAAAVKQGLVADSVSLERIIGSMR